MKCYHPPYPLCSAPTILLVEVDLALVLVSALQSLLHLLGHMLAGVSTVQEATAAVLLHHLCPCEARKFTEAVRAVDDGVATVALGVTQQEVTVCERENRKECQKTFGHFWAAQICSQVHHVYVWGFVRSCSLHLNQSLFDSLNSCQSSASFRSTLVNKLKVHMKDTLV